MITLILAETGAELTHIQIILGYMATVVDLITSALLLYKLIKLKKLTLKDIKNLIFKSRKGKNVDKCLNILADELEKLDKKDDTKNG